MKLFLAFALLAGSAFAAQPGPPLDLKCEYLANPLGIDVAKPRLSWHVNDDRRGAVQSAYQIVVNGVWDTGKVVSNQSIQVEYGGPALASAKRYTWKVRTWDGGGKASSWSADAFWEMGLLAPSDWKARWISTPPPPQPEPLPPARWIWYPKSGKHGRVLLEKELEIPAGARIASAEVQFSINVTGELDVNGERAGFSDGHLWRSVDLKPFLRPGRNRFAIQAGSAGRGVTLPGGAALSAVVRLEDGRVLSLITDETWSASVPDMRKGESLVMLGVESTRTRAEAVPQLEDLPWAKPAKIQNANLQPAPMFRRDFRLKRTVREARAYICGLGYYEFYLNGERIGDHVLDPGQTDYNHRSLYVTYDVTAALRRGENAAGVILGDGFYNQKLIWADFSYGIPSVLAQIQVRYDNGETETIVTDNTWKYTLDGPIRANNVYWGETYDARREMAGWNRAGFSDAGWKAAVEIAVPTPRLESQLMPPIKRMQFLKPVAITEPKPGVYVFDMGQNFAGWARLKAALPAGTEIRMRFVELLWPDGMINPTTAGIGATHVIQTDRYIARGGGVETWEPRFTYHGFRYVEVTGLPSKPGLDLLEGVVVHTAVERAGSFECSDAMLNRLQQATLWTQRSNMHSIPTDCPARERCGWTGDAQVDSEMAIYNFDYALFLSKYLVDVETSLNQGLPTLIAPGKRITNYIACPEWASAWVQLPWYMYTYYADRRPMERAYPHWTRYISSLKEDIGGDGLLKDATVETAIRPYGYAIGDHPSPFHATPRDFTGNAYTYLDALLAGRGARLLGREGEAAPFEQFAREFRQAFIRKYYKDGSFGSQTGDSLALEFGLVPDGKTRAVASSLANDVMQTHGGHFTTGILGHRYLYESLSDNGHDNAAYTVLTKTDFPSWGLLFNLGATTFWEVPARGVDANLPSLNHPMYAGFAAWFYAGVAGIQPDPLKPGFQHIVMRPALYRELRYAKASHRSLYGEIESEWRVADHRFEWRIVVPPNATATIYVPTRDAAAIEESAGPALKAAAVRFAGMKDGRAVYEIGAGSYRFSSPL
ncbi:MAG: glycoside hydrolase family 78 protein [Acidobacteria bacterium]|nr:glycoside hydrolase family 78 protein [Acidobacteriota bacterium]